MKVNRLDLGELRSPQTRPDGSLRVDAYLTRAGVFEYRTKEGKVRREFRSPDEVFKADSLASLELVTFTNDHPTVGKVSIDNLNQYKVGTVGEKIERIDDKVRASIIVTDAATIQAIRRGKTQTSAGYSCEIEEKAGSWNGERYDASQHDIEYNHVALVNRGRAGPEVSVRADRYDAWQREPKMRIVKLDDGKEYEVPDEVAAALDAKPQPQAQTRADDSETVKSLRADAQKAQEEAQQHKARADAARAEALKAADTARVEYKLRLDTLDKARELGAAEGLNLDMKPRDIMVKALATAAPEFKIDDKTGDAYVQAAFDIAFERRADKGLSDVNRAFHGDSVDGNGKRVTKMDEVRSYIDRADMKPGEGIDPKLGIADAARDAFIVEQRNRWKNPQASQDPRQQTK